MVEGSRTCTRADSGDVDSKYNKAAQTGGETAPSIRSEHLFVAMVMNRLRDEVGKES